MLWWYTVVWGVSGQCGKETKNSYLWGVGYFCDNFILKACTVIPF